MESIQFGPYLRSRRERLKAENPAFSVRQVAERVGLEPSYLSKIERGEQAPPSEAKIRALAEDLGEDPDVLLAMAGKISTDLQEIIKNRPTLFADLIRQLKEMTVIEVNFRLVGDRIRETAFNLKWTISPNLKVTERCGGFSGHIHVKVYYP